MSSPLPMNFRTERRGIALLLFISVVNNHLASGGRQVSLSPPAQNVSKPFPVTLFSSKTVRDTLSAFPLAIPFHLGNEPLYLFRCDNILS